MIIENKGIKKDNYFIPSFELNKGEIIVLYLFGGQHFYPTKMYLKDIFTGKLKDENVLVNMPLKKNTENSLRVINYKIV